MKISVGKNIFPAGDYYGQQILSEYTGHLFASPILYKTFNLQKNSLNDSTVLIIKKYLIKNKRNKVISGFLSESISFAISDLNLYLTFCI